jgi:hypothetical protein
MLKKGVISQSILNAHLVVLDDLCISMGKIPISVMLKHDDEFASPSNALYATIHKHNLNRKGESDLDCAYRLRDDFIKLSKTIDMAEFYRPIFKNI